MLNKKLLKKLPKRLYRKMINIPNPLAKSFVGKYFVGYSDDLTLGEGTSAWAGLFNPIGSGVYMFVNVWTITELLNISPIRAQIWFNSTLPGQPSADTTVTPSNKALVPSPIPRVKLLKANNVTGSPTGGVKAFVRRTDPGTTQVFEEDGKYIFAPGGNLTVFISNPETSEELASARVAFGWWEEKHYTL